MPLRSFWSMFLVLVSRLLSTLMVALLANRIPRMMPHVGRHLVGVGGLFLTKLRRGELFVSSSANLEPT